MIDELTVTPLDGEPGALPAAIDGAGGKGVLRLSLNQPLVQGSIVRVAAGDQFWTTGRVLYSLGKGTHHTAAIGVQQDERRTGARIQVKEDGEVVSLHTHTPVHCKAEVADVSKGGIGLLTGTYLSRDLLVKVRLDSAIVFGEVRHCTPLAGDVGMYKVGIEIQTVIFRNDSQDWTFKPRVLWASLSAGLQHLASRLGGR